MHIELLDEGQPATVLVERMTGVHDRPNEVIVHYRDTSDKLTSAKFDRPYEELRDNLSTGVISLIQDQDMSWNGGVKKIGPGETLRTEPRLPVRSGIGFSRHGG